MKEKKLIIILSSAVILCVGIIIYLIFFKDILNSDYNKISKDKNIVLVDDSKDKLDKEQGGGAVSLSYKKEVNIDLKTKKINMYFKNPARSTQSLLINIVVTKDGEDVIIGNTGGIPSGYAISSIYLNENVDIKSGTYEGKFVVNYYDEETEEKAVVDTTIPISITVK